MIIGIGSDIVQIPRIEKLIHQFGDKFLQRIFTEEEQHLVKKFTDDYKICGYYAKRFAAKEACAKALGTGIRHGIAFTDFSIVSDMDGKPEIKLFRKARELLSARSYKTKVHLTLSDDYPSAFAMVVIESL